MNEKARSQISSLAPFKRYQYFIKKVADFEELWVLKNDNNDLAFASVEGEIIVPLWSAIEFVNGCLIGVWEKYHPEKIELKDFETLVLSFVESQKALLDIFPVGSKSGFVVTYEEYKRDLEEELENYE